MLRARSIPFPIFVGLMSFLVFASVITFTSQRQGAELTAIDRFKADAAFPTPKEPLTAEQKSELLQGIVFFVNKKYAEAAPVLGKYALMGNSSAQSTIGVMFYSGLGVEADRAEAIKWLRLAIAQGDEPGRLFLADVVSATMASHQQDDPSADVGVPAAVPQGGMDVLSRQVGLAAPLPPPTTLSDSQPSVRDSLAMATQPVVPGPASRGYPPNRDYAPNLIDAPPAKLNFGSGVILSRGGPGFHSAENGDIYTQAGPNGVVNARTGEFSPTNR